MKNGIAIKIRFLLQLGLLLLVSAGFSACNDQNAHAATAQSNEMKFYAEGKNKDEQFLMDAAQMSIEEIKLGQLAQKKSINIDIQEFGKMLEDAHTKILNELIPLAKTKSITIPIELTGRSQDAYNQLVSIQLNYFNKAYCDITVSRHQEVVARFQKVFTESTDDDVRRWALSKLPALRTHLELAEMTQKQFEPLK
jgi:putative membrane protein